MQYPLGTTERELLIGPNHSVTPVKRVVIDNPHTHRRIFYNGAQNERPNSRHCASYVQLLPNTPHTPQFTCIKHLFYHTFAGKKYTIAALICYQNAKKDEETGLWWVPTNGTTNLLVPLDQLSSPLPVAVEGELLWFLNSHA